MDTMGVMDRIDEGKCPAPQESTCSLLFRFCIAAA
jgi:hypothetical protein